MTYFKLNDSIVLKGDFILTKIAQKLLEDIREEYQIRLEDGKSRQCVAFNKNTFTTKYNYSEEIIDDLLTELSDNGYIKKWITGGFELIID